MNEIKSIDDFKQHIKPCREIKIHRKKFDYSHHAFVGYVDDSRCDIYHYKPQTEEFFYGHSPFRITCDKLNFANYETNNEIKKIFDFKKGDVVIIVDRPDYPETDDEIINLIKRAESRLDEVEYSLCFNNCESFVNWIFTNENMSKQYENSGIGKRMAAAAFDSMLNEGIKKPVIHSITGTMIGGTNKKGITGTAGGNASTKKTTSENKNDNVKLAAYVLEGALLTKTLYDLKTNRILSSEQKKRSATREISSCIAGFKIGSVGSVVGQSVIPIPFFGAAVGGLVGGMLGNAAGGAIGDRLFSLYANTF